MKTLYDYCMENGSDLLSQWHPTRNDDLHPSGVTSGANRNVWWICPLGHEYQALVKDRVRRGSGCPYCAGRKVLVGFNDLATFYPKVASQWHPDRNGDLTPQTVTHGSKKRVWWQCAEGHEWEASVKDRTAGTECPECVRRTKKLNKEKMATTHPHLVPQWHPTLNGLLTPDDVAPKSNRKVWWICDQGHSYQAIVAHRVQSGSGCPYCAGRKVLVGFNDLASHHPDVATQWHPELNGDLTPEMVTPSSHKRIWWICSEGHVWQARVDSRTGERNAGCPVCAGKRKADEIP